MFKEKTVRSNFKKIRILICFQKQLFTIKSLLKYFVLGTKETLLQRRGKN